MRISNQEVHARDYRIIELKRKHQTPLKLNVFALPLSFDSMYDKIVPRPYPRVVTSKKDGRDVKELDFTDRDYLVASNEHEALRIYYQVYLALKPDNNVQFTAQPFDKPTLIEFQKELETAGIGLGDIQQIAQAALAASNIGTEEVEEAKGGFMESPKE